MIKMARNWFGCICVIFCYVSYVFAKAVRQSSPCFAYKDLLTYYKFAVVYCESVNLIGYITVDYLLIFYGNIVACAIVHMILFIQASVHMARHI